MSENNNNSVKIELPFFAGFYESPLSPYEMLSGDLGCGGLEYYREDFGGEMDDDDLGIDLKSFKKKVGEVFTELFEWEFKFSYKGLIENMDFGGIISPREYNFESDRIFANVTFGEGWKERIRTFMDNNKTWLEGVIKKEWTSCSGFVSYLPNTFDDWYDEFGKDRPDWRMIGVMLGYMLECELKEPMDKLTDGVLERVNISEFVIDARKSVSVVWDIEDECGEGAELPSVVKVPSYVWEERIADWLSNTYGFCVLYYNFN